MYFRKAATFIGYGFKGNVAPGIKRLTFNGNPPSIAKDFGVDVLTNQSNFVQIDCGRRHFNKDLVDSFGGLSCGIAEE